MTNQVYANTMEVSCKQADGKTICAMPDVCMTPPQTPATPPGVPIPYPNTGMASDCSDGSSTVKISGQEVMLKNKSFFKKSTGDEAGSAPMKGVITHSITGKVYFIAWSMDVKIEGENAVRHLDMTTGNHACPNPNEAAPFTYAQRMAMAEGLDACDGDREKVKDNCDIDPDNPADRKKKPQCPSAAGIKTAKGARTDAKAALKAAPKDTTPKKTLMKLERAYDDANAGVTEAYEDYADAVAEDPCQEALKCFLANEKPSRCCPGQTPHHLIPSSAIVAEGGRGKTGGENVLSEFSSYKSTKAPCVCVTGPDARTASHGEAHITWSDYLSSVNDREAKLSYKQGPAKKAKVIKYSEAVQGAKITARAVAEDCDEDCIEAQVNQGHVGEPEATKADGNKSVRRTMEGGKDMEDAEV
jgi:hypothetical protein